MPKKTLIILADGFEEIEAVTCIDTLRRAEMEVLVHSISGDRVTGAHGLKVIPDRAVDGDSSLYDAIVLPGGMPGARHLADSKIVRRMIKEIFDRGGLVAAICASPALVLGPTGILESKNATCYPGMEAEFPPGVKLSQQRVVADGNVITSRGPGTALAFSLAIVESLYGKKRMEELAKKMLACV